MCSWVRPVFFSPAREPMMKQRCAWVGEDPLMIEYHDQVWGYPVHDDRALFEKLSLDMFQAGLSWRTILRKRENFVSAFEGFDVVRVARYGQKDIRRLMGNTGIVRNRLKIDSTIQNAKCVLSLKSAGTNLSPYLWQFAWTEPNRKRAKLDSDVPARSPESELMAKQLKRDGFRFLGPTILYAFMQAVGMIDDHVQACFRTRS